MSEHSQSSHNYFNMPPEIPRLTDEEFIVHILSRLEGAYGTDNADFSRIMLGEYLHNTLVLLRSNHPSLFERFSYLVGEVNTGLGGDTACMAVDAKNFSNFLIVGYDLMCLSYATHNKEIPPDYPQQPWHKGDNITTMEDLFHEMNLSQLRIVNTHPALAHALHAFMNITESTAESPYAQGMATAAAAEVYDAFVQLEATHLNNQ